MRTIVLGSGPVGMTAALLLARHGHEVTLVDRDAGPVEGLPWERAGVMQFHLPHSFRTPGRNLLAERLPDVLDALLGAGVVDVGTTLRSRRPTFERALWEATSHEPGVTRRTGHIDAIVVDAGTTTGVVVDHAFFRADLVVDASGRTGRLSASYRPPAQSSDCGVAYAARLYALDPGARPGPWDGSPVMVREQQGFICLLFINDARTFTVLFIRATDDRALTCLRHPEAFQAATGLLPDIAAWVDPARSTPIDKVRAGAGLTNSYQPQPRAVRRLLAIGDAVCTTNPMGARGVSLGMRSAAALTDIVTTEREQDWAVQLDTWCTQNLKSWYDDHVATDAAVVDRLHGLPLDIDAYVTWDLVAAAAVHRPDFLPTLGPFLAMTASPASIDPLRGEVRAMLRAGWRPPRPHGASRHDLLTAATTALTTA